MEVTLPLVLIVAAVFALVLLHRISSQLETLDEKLADWLAHEGVKGYSLDSDPD